MVQNECPDFDAFEAVGDYRKSRFGDETLIEFGRRKDGKKSCRLEINRPDADKLKVTVGDRCTIRVNGSGQIELTRCDEPTSGSRKIAYNSKTSSCRAGISMDSLYDLFRERYGEGYVQPMMMVFRGDQRVIFGPIG